MTARLHKQTTTKRQKNIDTTRLVINDKVNNRLYSNRETEAFCKKSFNMSANQVYAYLADGLSNTFNVTVTLSLSDKPDNVSIDIDVNKKIGNKHIASDSRAINLRSDTVDPGDIFVSHGTDSQGIGKKLAFNQMRFFKKIGMSRMHIYAGHDVGGYFWAKMGFVFDPGERRSFGSTFSYEEINTKKEILSDFLPEAMQCEIEEAIANIEDGRDPYAIWGLIDFDYDIKEHLSYEEVYDIVSTFREDGLISNGSFRRLMDRDRITISQLLLDGMNWEGLFEFSDKNQIKQLETYTKRSLSSSPKL